MQRIRIHFEDYGQGFLWWDLELVNHYFYRIVDTDSQSFAWCGMLIYAPSIAEERNPLLSDGGMLKYPIWKIQTRHVFITSDPGDEQYHITSLAV